MIKQIFLLAMSLFSVGVKSFNSPILNISIPKSGTFLLMRALELITSTSCHVGIDPQVYKPSIDILEKSLQHNGFSCLHLAFKPEFEEFLKQKNAKVFMMYRDPRDQLVSQVRFMFMLADHYSRSYGGFTFDSLLTSLIGNDVKSPFEFEHFQDMDMEILSSKEYISHIKRFYELFLGWEKSGICCAVKFEDLVGPKGGGTLERQKSAITNIAKHLGVSLSEYQIDYIVSNLFGNTATFKEGQIGSWPKYFTEEHVKQFKEVAGDLLIKLGYETDYRWGLKLNSEKA